MISDEKYEDLREEIIIRFQEVFGDRFINYYDNGFGDEFDITKLDRAIDLACDYIISTSNIDTYTVGECKFAVRKVIFDSLLNIN